MKLISLLISFLESNHLESISGVHLTRHLISGQSERPKSNILSESLVTPAIMMLAALSPVNLTPAARGLGFHCVPQHCRRSKCASGAFSKFSKQIEMQLNSVKLISQLMSLLDGNSFGGLQVFLAHN